MMADTRAHTSDNTYSHSHVLYSSINMSILTCRKDITYVYSRCTNVHCITVLQRYTMRSASVVACMHATYHRDD